MQYAEALRLAEDARSVLTPYCTRILIAGSIRRQRPEVKDIELVAVPKRIPADLFGDVLAVDLDFIATVNQWRKVKGEPTGRYTQRVLPGGMTLDLFIATPENWGWIVALRTGSSGFNQEVLLKAMHRQGYTSEDGVLHRQGQRVPTPEETDVFGRLQLPWVDPWGREV